MIGISTEKVVRIIACAREHDARDHGWKDALESGFSEENDLLVLSEFGGEGEQSELAVILGELNDEEQASLVALAWVGRGAFSPGEIAEAIEAAKADAASKAGNYLMGIPLLADYLEDGLDKLGVSVAETS